jgi:hypothetical protein
VLGFAAVPTADGAAADFVLGQSDFTSSSSGTSDTKFANPYYSAVAGGKLLVTDFNNNRVLIWNSLPTTNGAPADVVVGQPDFTTAAIPAGVTAASIVPFCPWTDGTRLVVGDFRGRRVLIWNPIPTTNNAPADVVVGAADFTTVGSLWFGPGATSDGTSLFVSDTDNHRVLIYRPFPTTSDPLPSGVLAKATSRTRRRTTTIRTGLPTRIRRGGLFTSHWACL